MPIIGLTGTFGSGKSTVAGMFAQLGCQVIDADKVVGGLLAPGGKAEKKVAKLFGHAILGQSNTIDRKLLAKIVFQDPRELKKLTDILYPIGLKEIKKKIAQARREQIIVLDVPLLFESGWDSLADVTIAVKSNQDVQITRLIKRTGLSKADIKRRMKCQLPAREKLGRADIIIDNRGTLTQTNAQVRAVVHRLLQRIN